MVLNRRLLQGMAVILVVVFVLSASTSDLLAQDAPNCTIWVQLGESIQTAIDQAPEGAVICLAEGTWEENIKIEKSLTLQGLNPEKTIIKGETYGNSVIWITTLHDVQTVSVKIEGLSVSGAKGRCSDSSPVFCADGISAAGTSIVVIDNVKVIANWNHGIEANDQAVVEIMDCVIDNNGFHGLRLSGDSHVTLRNTTVSNNEKAGIRVAGHAKTIIANATISSNGYDGISVSADSQIEVYTSTVADNGDDGIDIWGSAVAKVQDCIVENNGSRWSSAYAQLKNCIGIIVAQHSQTVIINSVIRNNRDWGVASVSVEAGYTYSHVRRYGFKGQIEFQGENLIYGNNTLDNQDGMGNPGRHPFTDLPGDGQVCLP